MSKTFDLESWLAKRRAEINALLEARLPAAPAEEDAGRLIEAMRYSLLAPGKRLRPILALAAAESTGAEMTDAVKLAATTLELVHCYSLIHDDLPAMDDDDTRRGRASSHKMFGEATAILTGDALLTLAFEWLAEAGLLARTAPEEGRWARSSRAVSFINAARTLGRSAGMWGMVRGQARDLAGPAPKTIEQLERLQREKTGALFRAALEIGGLAAGASGGQLTALTAFGEHYGVAFQHADDLSDGEHKALSAAIKARLPLLVSNAVSALEPLGSSAEPLRALARALTK
jgi:geranylgeranyl diphosphate synthase type II